MGTISSEMIKLRDVSSLILIYRLLEHINPEAEPDKSLVPTYNKIYQELTGKSEDDENYTPPLTYSTKENGKKTIVGSLLPGGLRVASLSYAGFFSKGYVTLSFYAKVSGSTAAINVAVIPRSIYEGDVDFSKWSAGEGDKPEGTVSQIKLPSSDEWFKVSKTFDLSNIDPLTDALYVVLDSFSPRDGTLRVVSFSDIKLEYGRYSTRFDPNYIDDLDKYRSYSSYQEEGAASTVSTMSVDSSNLETTITHYTREFNDVVSAGGGSLIDPRLLSHYSKVRRLLLEVEKEVGEVVEQ